MSLAMTSFDVKLSVVPGWKCSGQMMADCFELSVGVCEPIIGIIVGGDIEKLFVSFGSEIGIN